MGENVAIPENWKDALPEDVRKHEALAGISDLPGLATEFLKVHAAAADWKAGLVDELKNDPSIAQIKDINSMAKSFIHAQRMVGANKVMVPGEKATPEEWNAFYKAVGRPDAPEGYDLPGPKDEKAAGYEAYKQFRDTVHKAGLTNTQAATVLDFLVNLGESEYAGVEASMKQEREQAAADLRKEWGLAYEKNVAIANRLVKVFGGDEKSQQALADAMNGNPQVVKFCAAIGSKLLEDNLLGEVSGSSALSPAEAKAKVDGILRDKTHPYHNANTPGHADAVREVSKLYEQMYPAAA